MDCDFINTALETQAQPLLRRKLIFIKGGFLHNSNSDHNNTDPIEPPKPAELTPQDEIYSLMTAYSPSNSVLRNVGCGLVNLGNTCFLNSALQCLMHTPPLSVYLSQRLHEQKCSQGRKGQFCALCSLESLFTESHLKTSSGKIMRPITIVKNIKSVGKQFHALRQEDCHEFMRCFLDAMQMSSIGFNKKMPIALQRTSIISRIFQGVFKSRVICYNCHNDSTITEYFMDLSLEINNALSITQSLEKFFRLEHLSGDNKYYCNHCKKLVDADKQFTIDNRIV